jgi:hypothetical protein
MARAWSVIRSSITNAGISSLPFTTGSKRSHEARKDAGGRVSDVAKGEAVAAPPEGLPVRHPWLRRSLRLSPMPNEETPGFAAGGPSLYRVPCAQEI